MPMNSSRCVTRTGDGHAHWKQKPRPSLCRKEKHNNTGMMHAGWKTLPGLRPSCLIHGVT